MSKLKKLAPNCERHKGVAYLASLDEDSECIGCFIEAREREKQQAMFGKILDKLNELVRSARGESK